MNAKLNRLMKDESGVTALETAIILIAFVVVAAIFAFTVLSTGTFLTEKSKEAAYAGLQEVRGSMELKGSVVAYDGGTAAPQFVQAANGTVDAIELTLATAAGGSSVDLSTGSNAKVQVTYHDGENNLILTSALKAAGAVQGTWIVYSCDGCGGSTDGWILTPGKLARVAVYPPTAAVTNLTAYKRFSIEIKPPTGGTMLIERTLPAQIDTITDLK
jgi:archaeal flagellin FlaB